MNAFARDDAMQRAVRDAILVPQFYRRYATEGRYVLIDKGALATDMQKLFAVDTIVQGAGGAAVCIEEKIVRWPKRGEPYSAYALETLSCSVEGRRKAGWMHYGRADWLLYCFRQADDGLLCHLIPFHELKEWFWPQKERFPLSVTDQINRSVCRVTPIRAVRDALKVREFRLEAPEGRLPA